MENSLYTKIGLDPAFVDIFLIVLVVVLFVLLVSVNMKYSRMKNNYASFMRGKDGKNLEDSILDKFSELDAIAILAKKNRQEVKEINRKTEKYYQKQGIVKYDAFHEMGGNLSFALAILDAKDNGWIINAMHSREGCYTYIKEIVKAESFIELSDEEAEALEKAIYSDIIEETSI